nr:coiled-coil domain-containing protein 17 isoform X2 [Zonotrichia albicollis]
MAVSEHFVTSEGHGAAGPPSSCFLWIALVPQRYFSPIPVPVVNSGNVLGWGRGPPASSIATVASNTAATAATASSRVLDMGPFLCPRCRLAFRSRPLLRVHMEKLCLGPTAPSSSSGLRGGNPLPAEGAQGTARKPQDLSAGVSQNTDNAEPRHHFVPRGVAPAPRGQQGPGRARGAPLGDVLTPRERALLRTANPTARRLPGEGEPPRQPPPRQEQRQPPQELLEAHERQVAEIRASTRQLERQREGLCRQLATLGARAEQGEPEQGEPEPSQGLRDQAGHVQTAQHRATLDLDTLLPPAGPLAAEARALRVSYLHSGGHDPAILDQLLHLQLEATVLEKGTAGLHRGRQMEPPSTGTHSLDAALLAMELENQRLEDELLALKVRRERRADAGSQAAQRHTQELARLQAEVGMLRCHAEQTRPWMHPSVCPYPVAHPLPPAPAVPEFLTVRASAQGNFQLSKEERGKLGLGCQLGRDDGYGGTSLGIFRNSSLCCTWG